MSGPDLLGPYLHLPPSLIASERLYRVPGNVLSCLSKLDLGRLLRTFESLGLSYM
jgi:hypothetical protein